MDHADAVIVGAGPAALAAAIELDRHGVDTLVVDEQPRPGGQIFRQPPASFHAPAGAAPRPGDALLDKAECAAGVRWAPRTTAWGVFGMDTELDSYGGGVPVPQR